MTLTYELGLGIPKTYLHTKNEVSRSRLSKVRARNRTERQTDATESIVHDASYDINIVVLM